LPLSLLQEPVSAGWIEESVLVVVVLCSVGVFGETRVVALFSVFMVLHDIGVGTLAMVVVFLLLGASFRDERKVGFSVLILGETEAGK